MNFLKITTKNNPIVENGYVNKKFISTGTSICAVPYNKGYLMISDTRATNTSTYEYFATDKLINYKKNFAIGAAGAAVGLEMVVYPLLNYFEDYLDFYKYDLQEIQNPFVFLTLFNKAVQKYNTEQASPLYMELLSMGKYILLFRNKYFKFSFSCNLFGDDLIESFNSNSVNQELAKKNKYVGDIVAIGSGGRYLLGSFMNLNEEKLLKERDKLDVITEAKKIYLNVTCKDGASSVAEYLEVIDVPENMNQTIQKERIIF